MLTGLAGCNQPSDTELITNDQAVCLKVGKKTTKSELKKIVVDLLAKKNIEIDFSDSEFTKSENIKSLDLKVGYREGYSGQFTAPISNFAGVRYGFRRNYSSNAAVPLEMCSMN